MLQKQHQLQCQWKEALLCLLHCDQETTGISHGNTVHLTLPWPKMVEALRTRAEILAASPDNMHLIQQKEEKNIPVDLLTLQQLHYK